MPVPRHLRSRRRPPITDIGPQPPAAAPDPPRHPRFSAHRPRRLPRRRLPRRGCAAADASRHGRPGRHRRTRTPPSPTSCARSRPASSTASSAARRIAPRSRRSTAAANFAPLWISNGALNERGKAAARLSRQASTPTGSIPTIIRFPQVKAGAEPDALAEAELQADADACSPSRVTRRPAACTTRASPPTSTMSSIASGAEPTCWPSSPTRPTSRAALDGFQPQQPGYKALKAKLAEARRGTGNVEQAAACPAVRR